MSNPADKSLSVGESAALTETNVKQGLEPAYEIEIQFTDRSEIVQDYT